MGLTAVLAGGIALNSTAANVKSVQYDISVRSSSTHTVALSGSDLYVWGTNAESQFPDSKLVYSPEPIQVQSKVADAAVSTNRTLTVSSTGELRAYGLEPASKTMIPLKGLVLATDAVQVAASDFFAAYVSKDGALYTWGQNELSQLGDGTTNASTEPVKILDSGVKKVSLGRYFGLALMEDGSVYGWGDNSYLQLGTSEYNGSMNQVNKPVKIAENVKDISTGFFHSCLLKQNGSLWTCGDNDFSQTGTGDFKPTPLMQIMTGVRSVTAGNYHNFAVSNDGAVYAWGYGLSGQLGHGDSQRMETPTETSFQYVQVFACDDNTFGVTADGFLYSFGNNTNYRLGKSNGSDSLRPVRILDQNMNWVYSEEEEYAEDGTEADPVDPVTPVDPADPSGTDPSDLPEADSAPEIVSTPFISGYEDGTFLPNKNVTRAEFLRMAISALCKDFDSTKNYGTCSFSDVPLGKWYEKYIAYAEQKKFVSGYSDGTFHPDEPIAREEVSVILTKILDLSTTDAPSAGFTDVPVGSWQTGAINALVSEGILNGDGNGKFRPGDPLARKEAVVAVSRAAGFQPDTDAKAALVKQFKTSPFSDAPIGEYYYAYLLRGVGYAK